MFNIVFQLGKQCSLLELILHIWRKKLKHTRNSTLSLSVVVVLVEIFHKFHLNSDSMKVTHLRVKWWRNYSSKISVNDFFYRIERLLPILTNKPDLTCARGRSHEIIGLCSHFICKTFLWSFISILNRW